MLKKNILVIGASGLLGKNFCKLFVNKYEIITCGRNKVSSKIKHIDLDLSKKIKINSLPKDIDVVLYLAQSYNFRDFPNSSEDIFCINTTKVLDFLNYSKEIGVSQFIYASTGGVYIQDKIHFEDDFIDAKKLNGFYATSKYCAELLVNSYKDFFDTVILRPFFMFGIEQKSDMLIPRLISNIKLHRPIQLQGQNGIKINPIYVEDAAKIVAKIIDENKTGIYNVAGNTTLSLKELCLIIGDILKKEPIFEYNENRANDVVGNFTKIGYEDFIKLEESIKRMV